jgi:hypothetical protein
MPGHAAPPRVPPQTQHLSPMNLSQYDLWNMETGKQATALGTNHWTNQHFANSVVYQVMGKETEYTELMKDQDLQPLWKRGFGNEADRLFQGIHNIKDTTHVYFLNSRTYQRTDKSHMAKLSVTMSLTKKKNNAPG